MLRSLARSSALRRAALLSPLSPHSSPPHTLLRAAAAQQRWLCAENKAAEGEAAEPAAEAAEPAAEGAAVEGAAAAASDEAEPADRVAELCLLYTSPSPRDGLLSRMPSSA